MTTVNNAYVAEFSTQVQHAYQGSQLLREAVDMVTGVNGATYQWPTVGAAVAQARPALGTDLSMNAGEFGNKKAIASDYYSHDYVDSFDQMKVNFSISQAYSERMGKALGRICDQVILGAIAADVAVTKSVAADFGGSASGLTLDKVIEAAELLNQDEADEDRFMVVHSKSLSSLLKDAKVTSAEYNTVRALTTGEIDSFMGFKFIRFGNRTEGGLPLAANIRTNYAWCKSAIGYAEFGEGVNIKTGYSADKGADAITGKVSVGAVVKYPLGVVKVLADESVA